MENRKKVILIFMAAALLLSAIAAVVQTVILTGYFDLDSHVYVTGSSAPVLFNILLAVCSLLFFLLLFLYREPERKLFPQNNLFFTLSSVLAGVAILAAGIVFFSFSMKRGALYGGSSDRTIYGFRMAAAILSLPSAAYFFLAAFRNKPFRRNTVLLAFAPILWTLVFLVSVYYDHSVRLGSPIRIMDQMALLAVAFFFLFEARFHMKRPNPGAYFAFSFLSAMLCAVSAIPHVILLVRGKTAFDNVSLFYLFLCVLILYIFARVSTFFGREYPEEEPEEIVQEAARETGEETSSME